MTTFGVNGSEGSKGSLIYKMATENLKAKGITKPTTEQIRAAMKEAANSVGITLDNETLDKIINSELEVKGLYVERNPKQETFVDFNDGAMKPKAGQNTLDKDFDKILEEIRQNPEKLISLKSKEDGESTPVNRLTEEQLQEILDLIKKLKPDPQGTTKAMGEEGGSTVTTEALNEEGGSGIRPIDITYALGENGGSVTTAALNEEGGGDNMTTKAMGEEGGSHMTTMAMGEEGGSGTISPGDLTLAIGENGGNTTTKAMYEEGGSAVTYAFGEGGGDLKPISDEDLQKIKDLLKKLKPNPQVTTKAMGEEGGSGLTPINITYAIGENGGEGQQISDEQLQKLKDLIQKLNPKPQETTKAMGEVGGGLQLSEELLQKLKDQIRKDNT